MTVYLGDVLITGTTKEKHLSALQVLDRMSKCMLMAPSVVYLGHQIDDQGLHPVLEKVKALQAECI